MTVSLGRSEGTHWDEVKVLTLQAENNHYGAFKIACSPVRHGKWPAIGAVYIWQLNERVVTSLLTTSARPFTCARVWRAWPLAPTSVEHDGGKSDNSFGTRRAWHLGKTPQFSRCLRRTEIPLNSTTAARFHGNSFPRRATIAG